MIVYHWLPWKKKKLEEEIPEFRTPNCVYEVEIGYRKTGRSLWQWKMSNDEKSRKAHLGFYGRSIRRKRFRKWGTHM